ncbi:MAG: 3-deoxy-manno-octulosonate cytidylyltransferase [Nitrospiraceae bacterium]|nr:3-deoxy-manno-octulosonate cytidylyltransferase [Nitrospiraceae bacterium]
MTSTESCKVLTIIPARFASTRFPGKIIAPLAGKPLVVHTYERALQARLVSDVVIATDAQEVAEAVRPFGANVVMTRPDHPSGTDRIAEVAANTDADIIVNVQGDEPLIDPNTIDATIRPLLDEPGLPMATVRHQITDPDKIADPNIVKVIADASGHAIYFSRTPIPYIRDEADRAANPACYWQHIGLYVYRRDFLLEYAQMPQTPLEQLEKLEQLRVIENGYSIAVVGTEYTCVGVDTPEDLELVRSMLEQS